jgi:hypothetical protein
LTIVDQNGQEVGAATDAFGGFIVRKIGTDAVAFYGSTAGLQTGPIDFYHSTPDCSDSRYVQIFGGAGFAYFAWTHGSTVFYTKSVDASAQVPVLAYEHFEATDDPTQPGRCLAIDGGGLASVGVVTTATDPVLGSLALPLRLK